MDQATHEGDYLCALAAGVASAMPIPVLDAVLASAVRGAAMRRVAARHGVAMSLEARRILGRADSSRHRAFRTDRPVASLADRLVARSSVTASVREVTAIAGAIHLFDAYLASGDRASTSPIEAGEARRVRSAIDRALAASADESFSRVPGAVGRTIGSILDGVRHVDGTGRSRIERMLDPLVDAVADVPSRATDALRAAFDEELAYLRPSEARVRG